MNRLDPNSNSRFKAQVRHYHRSSEGPGTWDDWVNPGRIKDKSSGRPLWILLAAIVIVLCVAALVAGFVLMTKPV